MASAPRVKRARNEAEKDLRRRAILNAALDLYETVGLNQVRVDAIARKAGIAKGTVYLYYKSREGIFIDIYEEAFADWLISFAKRPELSTTGARERIASIIAAHYLENTRFSRLHSALGHGIWTPLDDAEKTAAMEILQPGQDAFIDFLARALGISAKEAATRAKAVLAILAGYSQSSLLHGDDEALLTTMIDHQLRAL